jgi:hypothetical protein
VTVRSHHGDYFDIGVRATGYGARDISNNSEGTQNQRFPCFILLSTIVVDVLTIVVDVLTSG